MSTSPTYNFKKILVPIDFSNHSIMLVKKASQFAEKLGAELEILHVVESLTPYKGFVVPHIPLDSLGDDLNAYARKKMEKFLEENLETTAPYRATIVAGKDPANEIIRYAGEVGSDLIIIATQGFKGMPKFIFGSVTERVLKQSPCPVLSIKPR